MAWGSSPLEDHDRIRQELSFLSLLNESLELPIASVCWRGAGTLRRCRPRFQGCHGMPGSALVPSQPATSSPHRPAPREFINQVLGGLCIFILPTLLSLLFYQGTLGDKVMVNFNKNKIKMIKPFISVRDNLSSAG